MDLLLDTHVLLWWLADDERLRPSWKLAVSNPSNRVLLSAASIWEIAIESSIGKWPPIIPTSVALTDLASLVGFEDLPIHTRHAARVLALPKHHTDPFDRILIAQAVVDGLVLVTANSAIAAYDVRILV